MGGTREPGAALGPARLLAWSAYGRDDDVHSLTCGEVNRVAAFVHGKPIGDEMHASSVASPFCKIVARAFHPGKAQCRRQNAHLFRIE